jgi:hypothetical protein
LRLEGWNTSILKTERSPVISFQMDLYLSPRHTHVRAALSRGSGFVLWHLTANGRDLRALVRC